MIADAIHEFVTKGFAEQIMDVFGPTSLEKDGDAFLQMSDVTDAGRKLPFLFALQQLTQKFLFKKTFGHQAMSNLFGNAGILYLSNVADRMFYADADKTPNYTYP